MRRGDPGPGLRGEPAHRLEIKPPAPGTTARGPCGFWNLSSTLATPLTPSWVTLGKSKGHLSLSFRFPVVGTALGSAPCGEWMRCSVRPSRGLEG